VRLRRDVFVDVAVSRFWVLLPGHDLQLAAGMWFGERNRAFRLGFGYSPPARLGSALSALSTVLAAVAA
jgi:DNA-binding transcriptional MocR family regulator